MHLIDTIFYIAAFNKTWRIKLSTSDDGPKSSVPICIFHKITTLDMVSSFRTMDLHNVQISSAELSNKMA